jgi:hypothetical protein
LPVATSEIETTGQGGLSHRRSEAIPGLRPLHAITKGDPRVRVAVLDGPVDLSHASLRGARLQVLPTLRSGFAATGGASEHGTHIASIIFGQAGGPVAGIAPGCTGLIGPVFSDSPVGSAMPCSQLDLSRAIFQALEAGAHVINISGGQAAGTGEPESYLRQAIDACVTHNVLVVAAAGNQGCDCLHIPAAISPVLAVGAMDRNGVPLPLSNYGIGYRSRGIIAPGENVPGALPGGGIVCRSGTSMAAAVVAGVAGLLLSVQIERGWGANPAAIREILLATAIPCVLADETACAPFLVGRLNAAGALKAVLGNSERMPGTRSTNVLSRPTKGEMGVTPQSSDESLPPVRDTQVADSVISAAVVPSSCACGGDKNESVVPNKPSLVYALGTLAFDFGTEPRRDSLIQQGLGRVAPTPADDPELSKGDPNSPEIRLLTFLKRNPEAATAVIWLLVQQGTPIYAIYPSGPFAATGYRRLMDFLGQQLMEGVQQISIPGYIRGSVRLMNGQEVPAVVPEIRGMFSWNTDALVNSLTPPPPPGGADAARRGRKGASAADAEQAEATNRLLRDQVANFLDRIYYEFRNLGVESRERAMNYAATDAFQQTQIFRTSVEAGMRLASISVERSPLCRPGSDCWDIALTFFNPSKLIEQARRVHRYTIDVSDVIPVTVGPVGVGMSPDVTASTFPARNGPFARGEGTRDGSDVIAVPVFRNQKEEEL